MENKVFDERYNVLFHNSAIAILEEDFGEVIEALQFLPVHSDTQLSAYLNEHPKMARELMSKVRVVDVNPAALKLFEAESKNQFLGSLGRILSKETSRFLQEELIAIYRKKETVEGETINLTLGGKPVHLLISVSFFCAEASITRALVSMVDITDRKQRERAAEKRRFLSETIQEITMVVTGEVDRDRLLDLVLEQVRRIVDFTSGSVKLFHGRILKAERSLGYKERDAFEFVMNHEIDPLYYPVIQQTIETGEPVVIGDAHAYSGWTVFPATAYIRSVIYLPLLDGEEVIGEIALEHELPNMYTTEDAEHLKPFAAAVSLALKNSTLYRQLYDALQQREVLLRELHHRVKNNLALVNSLVNLQYAKTKDRETEEILAKIQRKISSILLVHEKLYMGDDLKYIKLCDYLHALLQELAASESGHRRIAVNEEIESSLFYSIERLIPLGLIIAELFTNSLKYAEIPVEQLLEFAVTVTISEGRALCFVADNGKGFSPDVSFGNPLNDSEGIGLSLVESLARQIDGDAEILPGPGGGVRFSFPLEKA
ncbi:PAS domain-containing sensor histidine kinase [Sediminispirochaeta bajacaliforniensis]|uniref:PAS domain-containing sensor histidine kinase n=1 Tax=Sediminispirochaeta bajacaliforniensis TaxID=148 RepID=UPI00037E66BB|nr:histidine kinase dimerization/phosphoacceptor domain -containing protein [Sediminispirochaeta bajacaliforniensis]